MRDSDIDIVIPWVDNSDVEWKKEYLSYKANSLCDNSEARYRDWDVFEYWFRSIEENAPWVRKIHFLTFGHIPKWLNTSNPKLNIVKHDEFIPEKYLPTFSSHVIELNIHRIKGLSERFIYFNDDVYLSNKTIKEDFFIKGMPLDSAVMGVIKNDGLHNFMPYIMLNMMGIINNEFSKEEVIKENLKKWYSKKYGKDLLKNIYLSGWNIFPGFRNYHTANSFLKSTFYEVWEKYPEILDKTCNNKFRSKEDVNQYIMRYWQLCKGEFIPHTPNSNYITIGKSPMREVSKLLYDKSFKIICINDDPMGFNFEKEKIKLLKVLKKKYKNKSSFEI